MAALCAVAVAVAAGGALLVYYVTEQAITTAMYRSHMSANVLWQFIRIPLFWTNLFLTSISIILAVTAVYVILKRSIRALRIIEESLHSFEAPMDPGSAHKKNALGIDVSTWHAENVCDQLGTFGAIADDLERAIAWNEESAPAEPQLRIDLLTPAIKKAADEIDRICGAFQ